MIIVDDNAISGCVFCVDAANKYHVNIFNLNRDNSLESNLGFVTEDRS